MPDVSGPHLPEHLRLHFRHSHRIGSQFGHLADCIGVAAADIDDLPNGTFAFERKAESARNIAYMHEIALLPAILKNERRLSVGETRREIGKHARVWIGKRLP